MHVHLDETLIMYNIQNKYTYFAKCSYQLSWTPFQTGWQGYIHQDHRPNSWFLSNFVYFLRYYYIILYVVHYCFTFLIYLYMHFLSLHSSVVWLLQAFLYRSGLLYCISWNIHESIAACLQSTTAVRSSLRFSFSMLVSWTRPSPLWRRVW